MMADLRAAFPDFVKSAFGESVLRVLRLPEDSARLKELLSYLWDMGYRPVVRGSKGPMVDGTYSVSPRQYPEAADLDAGEYLELSCGPENEIGEIYTGTMPDGKAVTGISEHGPEIHPEKRMGDLTGSYIGCSAEFARLMEDRGFVGLAFEAPPLLEGYEFPPGKELEVLTSLLLLPGLKNAVPAIPFPGGAITAEEVAALGWSGLKPGYSPPDLRFDKTDFEKLGAFDIARTREVFGTGRTREQVRPKLVVSQRFRRWLDSEGLECSYHPIRLEEPGDPEPDPPLAAICRELGMPLSTVPG